MASFSDRHDAFIREIQAPLKPRSNKTAKAASSVKNDSREKSFSEIQRELERKFDELFGNILDDEE